MSEKVFASGIYFDRNEKAPDFVVGRISVNVDKFIGWLQEQQQSERGYVNLNVKRGREGKIYVELDTWQPTKQEAPKRAAGNAYRDAREGRTATVDFDDALPF